jgi:hypothetical protein
MRNSWGARLQSDWSGGRTVRNKFTTRRAISGEMGTPPATTSRMLSNSLFGGVLFSKYPQAPAHSALKIRRKCRRTSALSSGSSSVQHSPITRTPPPPKMRGNQNGAVTVIIVPSPGEAPGNNVTSTSRTTHFCLGDSPWTGPQPVVRQ